MFKKINFHQLLFVTAIAVIAGGILLYPQSKKGPAKTYTIGFMKDLFYELDLNDVEAALKVWAGEILKESYSENDFHLRIRIYENIKEMEASIWPDNLAIVSLSTYDYLKNAGRIGLEPVFAPMTNEDIGLEYQVLVKKESNYKTLTDLKGKAIGINSSPIFLASHLWLDVILAKENLPPKNKCFGKIVEGQKESQLILNLFFGNMDACVVSKSSFNMMKELNPQVGKKIVSIMSSPLYMAGFLCFTRASKDKAIKHTFIESTVKLHNISYGRQLFTLLKIERLVPFKEQYLNEYKNLLRDHDKLVVKSKVN